MDKKTTEQKTLQMSSRGFFSPAVFFYAVADGCIFQSLSNFNSDANSGRASVPSEHKANSGYSFYVFIKGFQRWNYILLFSV